MARAILYGRSSTAHQERSTERQLDALHAWCDEHGHEVAGTFTDEAISGSTDPLDRPGFQDALDALEPGDLLVVTERSRVSRDGGHMVTFLQVLLERERQVELVALDTPKSDDPVLALVQEFATNLHGLMEKLKVQERNRRTTRAQRRKRAPWSAAPFGWRVVTTLDEDGKVVKALEEDEGEQEVLRLMRELREDGMSLRAIAAELNERGHRNRKGGEWAHQLVANALKDKFKEAA